MLSKGLFIFIYTSKTGYESFQKQWISLLEVHHSICCAESVGTQISHFTVHNLGADLGGK